MKLFLQKKNIIFKKTRQYFSKTFKKKKFVKDNILVSFKPERGVSHLILADMLFCLKINQSTRNKHSVWKMTYRKLTTRGKFLNAAE